LRQNISPIVWSTLSYKLACMNTRVKYHISVQEEVTRFPQGPSRDFSHWAFWLEPCLGATLCHQYSPDTLFQSLATNIWAPQLKGNHLPGHCGRRRAGLEPCGSHTLTASETLASWLLCWPQSLDGSLKIPGDGLSSAVSRTQKMVCRSPGAAHRSWLSRTSAIFLQPQRHISSWPLTQWMDLGKLSSETLKLGWVQTKAPGWLSVFFTNVAFEIGHSTPRVDT
jgi:hypothetical protein